MPKDYKQLYNELLKKYDKLQDELEHTKKTLETYIGLPIKQEIEEAYATHEKSNADLIQIFKELFKGRTDVYAKRYHNQKTNKSGYVLVCSNEWKNGICDKKKYKCHGCPHKKFIPLTEKIIEDHLHGRDPLGRDVIGIYPILPDETCYFLVVDFDKGNWQKDVASFRQTCFEKNIPVYIERSRSGQGAHAWFFFNEKIPVKLARKFGNIILTLTMNKNAQLKLASYDRLFPNQDYLPKGGFGNLIALPLQGNAVKNNNSLFIDEEFIPYQNQWKLLENVEKLNFEELNRLIESHEEDELGNLLDDHLATKPFKQQKLNFSLNQDDYPEQFNLVLSNRIFIHPSGVSARGFNELKRLSAFSNPKFYELQKARMSTHNVPRIIDCSKIDKGYLSLPRGCLEALKQLLESLNVNYEINDLRNLGEAMKVSFAGTLYDEQKEAAKNLLAHDTGVLSATTGFGKTVIAAKLIDERKVNTLVIIHNTTLMKQWKESLETFLIFEEEFQPTPSGRSRKKELSSVGLLGSGKNTLGNKVDIAMMQSLIKGNVVADVVLNYGMVIVDECHHVGAYGYEQILSAVKAKFVYGLSATPDRQDGRHPIVFMQCGAIRHYVTAKDQAKKRNFDHSFVTRFTTLKMPSNTDKDDFKISDAYELITLSEERNLKIVRDVIDSINDGRKPIILTNRITHVENLEKLIKKHTDCEIISLTGKGTKKQKRTKLERLAALSDDSRFVIVATGNYVGEGFDFPRLDTLFLVMPITGVGVLHQYAGRLHREYPGKKSVIIYDYVDILIRMLEKMYLKRVKGYAKLGYIAKTDYKKHEEVGVLFDEIDYFDPLKKDLTDARLSIIISSPNLKSSQVADITKLLQDLSLEPQNITIITSSENQYQSTETQKIKRLFNQLFLAGFTVVTQEKLHQKFIIIDEQIVWYGSVELLGSGENSEAMLRFLSNNLASELMNSTFQK